MNMSAHEYARPFTQAESIDSAVTLCALHLAQAMTYALDVTTTRLWPVEKAEEKLAAARNHYKTAKARGASADRLAQLAADGFAVVDAIKAAQVRVAEGVAVRQAKAAAKAAEVLKKVRRARAMELKGLFTGEAARYVAHALAVRGLAVDAPAAMHMIAAETLKTVALLDTKPDHIFEAWMVLDPA